MKRNFLFAILFFSVGVKAQIKEFDIHFETASHTLKTAEIIKIDHLLQALPKPAKAYNVSIIGHTDNTGAISYNQILSRKRANQIASYFRAKGFKSTKIEALGKGYSQPIATNTNDSGKSKNRRVTVIITDDYQKVNDLGGFRLKESIFNFDASEKQKIAYKSGSTISIPADAFEDQSGNLVKGKIDLTYLEYRNPIDFILGNIPMDFEGAPFNSAGMYKILAFQNEKPLFLKKDKNIDIDFPLESELPELNFYRFDTISSRWNTLSKLTEAVKGATNTKRVTEYKVIKSVDTLSTISQNVYFSTSLKYSGNSSLCTDYDICSGLYDLSTKGVEFAKLTAVFDSYKQNQIQDQKQLLAYKTRTDSLYLIQNKLKINRIDRSIDRYKTIIAQTEILKQKLDAKIKVSTDVTSLLKNDSSPQKTEIQKNKIKILQNYNAKFDQKIELLLKKIAILEKSKKPIYAVTLYQSSYSCFWERSKCHMTSEELMMTIDDWFCYFDANKPLMSERYAGIQIDEECKKIQQQREKEQLARQETERKINNATNSASQVTKSLRISNLGIYNCDQISRLYNPIVVDVTYKTENGAPVNPVFIYLVDSRINGIINYNGYNSYSPTHFAYSPTSKNTLLAFDENGNSYILNADGFEKLNGSTDAVSTIILKKIENIKTRESLTELF